ERTDDVVNVFLGCQIARKTPPAAGCDLGLQRLALILMEHLKPLGQRLKNARFGACVYQSPHFLAQSEVIATFLIEEGLDLARGNFAHRQKELRRRLKPLAGVHSAASPRICERSQARATLQSSATVERTTPRASAISSLVIPAKKRNSTTRARRASRTAS